MKKILASVILLFTAALNAHSKQNRDLYLGAKLGVVDYNDIFECSNCDEMPSFNKVSDNQVSLGILAGYRFSKYIASEVGNFGFQPGEYTNTVGRALLGQATTVSFEPELSGTYAVAIGLLPIGNRFELSAKAGIHSFKVKVASSSRSLERGVTRFQTISWDDEDVLLGAGATCLFNQHLKLGLMVEHFTASTEGFSIETLEPGDGRGYGFGLRNFSIQFMYQYSSGNQL